MAKRPVGVFVQSPLLESVRIAEVNRHIPRDGERSVIGLAADSSSWAFDDRNDDSALDLLARLYPGRRVQPVDERAIFVYGGGVHCISQQQPRVGQYVP
jgi:hypothetical protein